MLSNDEANIKTVPTDQLSRVYMKVLIGAGIQCITLIIKAAWSVTFDLLILEIMFLFYKNTVKKN